MKIHKGERRRARIEVIPMIDVTFLLLVFFIYLSLFMRIDRGIPLRLPQAETAEPQRLESLQVSVDRMGKIYVEKTPVNLDALAEIVGEAVRSRGLERVSLRGDRATAYERVMEVLDRLRQGGIGKVTLEARGEG